MRCRCQGPFSAPSTQEIHPVAPGDRVRTDKRDARRLARQLRAAELVGHPGCLTS